MSYSEFIEALARISMFFINGEQVHRLKMLIIKGKEKIENKVDESEDDEEEKD